MVNAGVNTCLSIDATPISTVNMFEIMRSLWQLGVPGGTSGHAPAGGHAGGHDANAQGAGSETLVPITLQQCLQMATIGGARALGLGAVTGSLTPGSELTSSSFQQPISTWFPLPIRTSPWYARAPSLTSTRSSWMAVSSSAAGGSSAPMSKP
jgi:hypothetical protein